MADPLNVAGLALSVTSLTFELFSGCVKGYNLLVEAKDMPKTCRHLIVRLQMEKHKLLGIHDAFREMQVLLLDVVKLKQRYSLHLVAEEDGGRSESIDAEDSLASRKLPAHLTALEERAVQLFDKTRKCPRRLRWASFDKERFEELLSAIALLNENMTHFLNSYEREKHYKMQEVTFMQVLQVSNRMDELLELVKTLQAVTVAPEGTASLTDSIKDRGEAQRQGYEARTVRLTRFRAVNLSINGTRHDDGSIGEQPSTQTLGVSLADLQLLPASEPQAPGQERRSCATLKGEPAWIEWRYYQPVFDDEDDEEEETGRPPTTLIIRIAKMAKLLSDSEKPPEFHIPECLGYVQDPWECRLGFVFKLQTLTEPAVPTSLRDQLMTRKKPSLTVRLRIARSIAASIWYLHSTEWLHKGLRSDNILFTAMAEGPLSAPVLAGFDYSRPAGLDETTERPTEDPWHELYRHPKTQFDVPREGKNGFRKLYDIYSLGVILFELGTWQPVHKVLGIAEDQRPKAAVVKSVQETLLSGDKLEFLDAEAGSMFSSAVKFCLTGGSDAAGGGRAPDDATLQLGFWEQVLARLEDIQI